MIVSREKILETFGTVAKKGYIISVLSFFCVYIIEQALGQDAWILAERALKKMIFVLVYFRALKRKPVKCYSDGACPYILIG